MNDVGTRKSILLRLKQKLSHYEDILMILDQLDAQLIVCLDPVKMREIRDSISLLEARLAETAKEIKELALKL